MPQIQDPELSERLRRKFGIVGHSSIDTIAPELVGVVIVDEVLPTTGQLFGFLSQDVQGDTGDIPEAGIRNIDPVRSLQVDRIRYSTLGTGEVHLRLGAPGGTELAAAIGVVQDQRSRGLLVPAHSASATDFNTVTGSGTIIWQAQSLPNTPYEIQPDSLILAPQGTLVGAVVRDVIHLDLQAAAGRILVSWEFHFLPPQQRFGV